MTKLKKKEEESNRIINNKYHLDYKGNNCWIDGSFGDTEQGVAHILVTDSTLQWYQFEFIGQPSSPFQTEAWALFKAMQAAAHNHIDACIFHSDCQLLIKFLKAAKRIQVIQSAN